MTNKAIFSSLKKWNSELIKIYCDGACSPNPGTGGWGALLHYKNQECRIYGHANYTTSNRMEMIAALRALDVFSGENNKNIIVFSDSRYLVNGMTVWIHNWKRRDWRTREGLVKNKELWLKLDAHADKHNISWKWVKGHNGHPENEVADMLANKGLRGIESKVIYWSSVMTKPRFWNKPRTRSVSCVQQPCCHYCEKPLTEPVLALGMPDDFYFHQECRSLYQDKSWLLESGV